MHACENRQSKDDRARARALCFHVPMGRKENSEALEDKNKLHFLPLFILDHCLTVYLLGRKINRLSSSKKQQA